MNLRHPIKVGISLILVSTLLVVLINRSPQEADTAQPAGTAQPADSNHTLGEPVLSTPSPRELSRSELGGSPGPSGSEVSQSPVAPGVLAPIYGNISVASTTIEAVLQHPDSLQEIEALAKKAQWTYGRLVAKIVREDPQLLKESISYRDALTASANGALVLSAASGDPDNPSVYILCPTQYASEVTELQMITILALNSKVHTEALLELWKARLHSSGGAEVEQLTTLPGGSGFALRDANGNVIKQFTFSIPAWMH